MRPRAYWICYYASLPACLCELFVRPRCCTHIHMMYAHTRYTHVVHLHTQIPRKPQTPNLQGLIIKRTRWYLQNRKKEVNPLYKNKKLKIIFNFVQGLLFYFCFFESNSVHLFWYLCTPVNFQFKKKIYRLLFSQGTDGRTDGQACLLNPT